MSVPQHSGEAASESANGAATVAATLLERLAARLGGTACTAAVFGEPVVSGGVTVIPVARVGFGFGGGAGRGNGHQRARERGTAEAKGLGTSEGGGGGGGAEARPLGFIEITDGAARYRPIRDTWGDVVVPLAALAVGMIAPKAVRAVARRAR
jgi:uncharacterized spore protein YtfJ